jgi:phage baseplate assembly protein W
MATVRLDNLIKPKQVNTQQTKVSENSYDKITYNDLHLDLSMTVSIGTSIKTGFSNDIKVDFDENAIRNSIRNCIYTKPGEKLLSPDFGMNLDKFLFEPLSNTQGDYIGRFVLSNLTRMEPRINVTKIYVKVDYDDNSYFLSIYYEIPNVNKKFSEDIILKSNVSSSK